MFKDGNVNIMRGEFSHLTFVCKELRNKGIASNVKNVMQGASGFYSVLFVDEKYESVARVVARDYVNNKAFRKLKVEEIFVNEFEEADESAAL